MKGKTKITHIVGVDEVGRGPLAGPVSVGVFVILKKDLRKLSVANDSKKLTEARREELFAYFSELKRTGICDFDVMHESAKVIDRIGISACIRRAMKRGLTKLRIQADGFAIRLDGSLYAPPEFTNQKTIIKGDSKEKVIGAASIVAKVTRDKLMVKMAKKYPAYGLEIHKGYGTAKHRKAITENGASEIHRKTWIKGL